MKFLGYLRFSSFFHKHSFISLFIKYLSVTNSVPGTLIVIISTGVNKTGKNPSRCETYTSVRDVIGRTEARLCDKETLKGCSLR